MRLSERTSFDRKIQSDWRVIAKVRVCFGLSLDLRNCHSKNVRYLGIRGRPDCGVWLLFKHVTEMQFILDQTRPNGKTNLQGTNHL